jgi:hypothetical protein
MIGPEKGVQRSIGTSEHFVSGSEAKNNLIKSNLTLKFY